MYTDQEILDRVRTVFVKEKKGPSMGKSEFGHLFGCYYSHEYNGVGCAVGCLIPDEIGKRWDHCGPISIVHEFKSSEFLAHFTSSQLALLRELQRSHDRFSNPEDDFAEFMDNATRRIAEVYGLEAN